MLRFNGRKDADRRAAVERGEWPFDNAVLHRAEHGRPFDFGIPDMRPYRKTSVTYAAQINEPFQVATLEGLHDGKAGDWLAIGQAGEMYPIDGEVFAMTYEEIT